MIERQPDLLIQTEHGIERIPCYRAGVKANGEVCWGKLEDAEIELDFSKHIDGHSKTRARLKAFRNFITKYLPFKPLLLGWLVIFENKYRLKIHTPDEMIKDCVKIRFPAEHEMPALQ